MLYQIKCWQRSKQFLVKLNMSFTKKTQDVMNYELVLMKYLGFQNWIISEIYTCNFVMNDETCRYSLVSLSRDGEVDRCVLYLLRRLWQLSHQLKAVLSFGKLVVKTLFVSIFCVYCVKKLSELQLSKAYSLSRTVLPLRAHTMENTRMIKPVYLRNRDI